MAMCWLGVSVLPKTTRFARSPSLEFHLISFTLLFFCFFPFFSLYVLIFLSAKIWKNITFGVCRSKFSQTSKLSQNALRRSLTASVYEVVSEQSRVRKHSWMSEVCSEVCASVMLSPACGMRVYKHWKSPETYKVIKIKTNKKNQPSLDFKVLVGLCSVSLAM